MDTFEQDLRRRLGRRDPAPGFTARVMAAVPSERREKVVEMPRGRRRRWALVGAVAAALAAGVFVWRDDADRRAEAARRAAAARTEVSRAEAEAEAQLFETLFLTGTKINQARTTVWGAGAAPPEEATRGEK